MAFHPEFDNNRYVYVCYVRKYDIPDGSVVSRFTASRTDPPVIDPQSELTILKYWSGGHNGGCLNFGNDGYLYISTGDGSVPSPPDVMMTGQDCSDLLSSVLRIDIDHAEPGKPYRIPPDNPFVNVTGVRPEIWAFGFRNPWKMSFDRATGELWVGDVGWELWELIFKVKRGGNYGWSVMEGPQPVNVEARRGPAPISPPIKVHPHSEAASITGGYVYHGTRLPELAGAYIYGDYQSGIIWGLRSQGEAVTWQRELARTPLHLVAFGETHDGELYLLDHDRTHQIYRLVPNSAPKNAARIPAPVEPDRPVCVNSRSSAGPWGDPLLGQCSHSGPTVQLPNDFWRFRAKAGSARTNRATGDFPTGSVLATYRLDRTASRENPPAADGWKRSSFIWKPGPGGRTHTFGTTIRPTRSWSTRQGRRRPWRCTRLAVGEK